MFLQDYEKLRLIGQGSFGSVYKVRHAKLGYIRALKVCNQIIEDENDKAWQTFIKECEVLLKIGNGSHPNIVHIYQPRLLDNKAVVEMDYVEGDSLHDYIEREKFIPIDEFFEFARQTVGAVAYCHVDIYRFLMDPMIDNLQIDPSDGRKYIIGPEKEKELIRKYGIVHNDLHSGNIIKRDYDGMYILLDFGLAIQNSNCVKSSSRFDGAIEYCSPEKLEHGDVSPRSDVYALGILLFEMLTGRVPFKYMDQEGLGPEASRSRVYQSHLNTPPPSIYALRKEAFESTHPGETYERDYPEELDHIIRICLAKSPKDRFANAKELLEALTTLRTWRKAPPSRPLPPPPPPPTQPGPPVSDPGPVPGPVPYHYDGRHGKNNKGMSSGLLAFLIILIVALIIAAVALYYYNFVDVEPEYDHDSTQIYIPPYEEETTMEDEQAPEIKAKETYVEPTYEPEEVPNATDEITEGVYIPELEESEASPADEAPMEEIVLIDSAM